MGGEGEERIRTRTFGGVEMNDVAEIKNDQQSFDRDHVKGISTRAEKGMEISSLRVRKRWLNS